MKKFLKVTGMILGILILLLAAVILYFRYEFQYKRTEMATSLEGSYTVTMYQIGEADGDYYDDELGFCHGLYRSPDEGMQWEFVESIPVNR